MIEINNKKIDPQEYIDKWTGWGLSTFVRSDEEIKESINWLYEKCDLVKPKEIIVCRSHEDFRDSVEDSAWNSVRNSVRKSVGSSVEGSVWNSVGNSVRNSVRNSVWDLVMDYNSPQYLADRLAFAEVFVDAGVLSKEKAEELENFKKHAEGICMIACGEETCVVLTSPKWNLNNDNQLHSEDDFAIKWNGDSGFYFLYGVRFEEELHNKVVEGKKDFEDIMGIENIDQRMAALKMLDVDKLLRQANTEKVDTSFKGDELWLVKDIFEQPEYFCRYECPSTGRVYLSGVPPEVGKEKHAGKAMAWKQHRTLEEYEYIKAES